MIDPDLAKWMMSVTSAIETILGSRVSPLLRASLDEAMRSGPTEFSLSSESPKVEAKRSKSDLFSDLLPLEWVPCLDFAEAWRGFVEMRMTKWPLTDRAVKLVVKTLRGIESSHGMAGIVASLDEATLKQYRDVYPPKGPAAAKPANSQPERWEDFIRSHPNKSYIQFLKWPVSPSTKTWILGEHGKWLKTGRHV